MDKNIIFILCCIVVVISIMVGYCGSKLIQETKTEGCLIPNEIAQQYMLNCKSVMIEDKVFTMCEQNTGG